MHDRDESEGRARHARVPRPALPPGILLLTSVACVTGFVPGAGAPARIAALAVASAVAATFLVVSSMSLRRRVGWIGAAALGAVLAAAALDPPFATGEPAEAMHVVGRLLDVPTRDADGEYRLTLRGGREPRGDAAVGGESARPATIALRVAISPLDVTRQLARLGPGDRLRVWARVRAPDPERDPGAWQRAAASGIDAYGSVKSARLVERVSASAHPLSRGIGRLQRAGRARLDAIFGPRGPRRQIAGAMLLGERSGLTPATWRLLRDAGLAHLVAISGLHVGVLVVALVAAGRRSGLGPTALSAVALVALPLLAAFVGARPSVARATTVAAIALTGRALGRRGDTVNTLFVVAAALAVARPAIVLGPAFQLTFLASLGIVGLAGPIAKALPGPAVLRQGIATTLAAYLATAPAAAAHFGHVAPIGLVANLVAVPLCGAILLSGFVALVFAPVALVAEPCSTVCAAALDLLLAVAAKCAAVGGGAFAVPAPGAAMIVVLYAGLLGVGWMAERQHPDARPFARGPGRAACAVLGLGFVLLHAGRPPGGAGETTLTLVDVGQGQSVLVEGGADGCVLIDAGGSFRQSWDPGERVVLPLLLARGRRRVDAIFLTHEHVDHAAGAPALLRALEVGEVWMGPTARRSALGRRIGDLAVERGAALRLATAGETAFRAGLPVQVLAPARGARFADVNHGSVVVRLGQAPHRVLVPGDLEAFGERALLDDVLDVSAEALVVAHHGSRHGSSERFLRRVAPRVALIAAGRNNRFGHPHEETLARLRRMRVPVVRTDQEGTLTFDATRGGFTLVADGVR